MAVLAFHPVVAMVVVGNLAFASTSLFVLVQMWRFRFLCRLQLYKTVLVLLCLIAGLNLVWVHKIDFLLALCCTGFEDV